MTTAIRPARAATLAPAKRPSPDKPPLLVASDGTDLSLPALEAALELSARTRVPVRMIGVLRDLPVPPVDFGTVGSPLADVAMFRERLLSRLKEQRVQVAGTNAQWPIEIGWGNAASEIARAADESGAGLIVLGVVHRTMTDRLFARETALALLRLTRVPLFVVPHGFICAPARITVATDFSHASLSAALMALDLYPSITKVDLVYVRPMGVMAPAHRIAPWMPPLDDMIDQGFAITRNALQAVRPVSVECVTLRGKAAREVTTFARANSADLLIMGSKGPGLLERMFVGSTARLVLRGSPCATLAVHPASRRDGPFALLNDRAQSDSPMTATMERVRNSSQN